MNQELTITIPEPMKQFVEGQVAQGGYGTVSEYIQALIREAQKRKADEKLETMLLEGLASQASEMTAEDWENVRRRGLERLAKPK